MCHEDALSLGEQYHRLQVFRRIVRKPRIHRVCGVVRDRREHDGVAVRRRLDRDIGADVNAGNANAAVNAVIARSAVTKQSRGSPGSPRRLCWLLAMTVSELFKLDSL